MLPEIIEKRAYVDAPDTPVFLFAALPAGVGNTHHGVIGYFITYIPNAPAKVDFFIKNKKVVYSLTRHEHDFSCPLIDKYRGSHDVFIFESPLNDQLIKHVQFVQSVNGSENVMLYELNKYGYNLYNPCKQILIVHEHKSNFREPNRPRINLGGFDGDNIYSIRSLSVEKILSSYG